MHIDRPRHFVSRRMKSGRVRYYWQPSESARLAGFKPRPLGDELAQAVAQAEALNKQWDEWNAGAVCPVEYGSLEWISREFRNSSRWPLNPASRKQYEWAIGLLLAKAKEWGQERAHIAGMDTESIALMRRQFDADSPYKARQAMSLMKLLLRYALARGIIPHNPMEGARNTNPEPRGHIWRDDEIDALVAVSSPAVARAVLIAANTGQRIGDILALTWSNVKPDGLTFRQIKTRALVRVPMTAALRKELESVKRDSLFVIPAVDGSQMAYSAFGRGFRKARALAGVRPDLQFRDFRRTCVVKLAEAGCEIPEICAITGHSLAGADSILETYLPRTAKMAARGIKKLERGKKK